MINYGVFTRKYFYAVSQTNEEELPSLVQLLQAPTIAIFFKLIPKITLFYSSLINIEVTISDNIMSDNTTLGNATPEIILPEVEINLFTPKNPTTATIAENYICTDDSSPNVIRHITIDLSGSGLEGVFRSGQSIGILPPGENEKGKPHKLRLYSVSSPSKGEQGSSSPRFNHC
jgi:hypothetical protein